MITVIKINIQFRSKYRKKVQKYKKKLLQQAAHQSGQSVHQFQVAVAVFFFFCSCTKGAGPVLCRVVKSPSPSEAYCWENKELSQRVRKQVNKQPFKCMWQLCPMTPVNTVELTILCGGFISPACCVVVVWLLCGCRRNFPPLSVVWKERNSRPQSPLLSSPFDFDSHFSMTVI